MYQSVFNNLPKEENKILTLIKIGDIVANNIKFGLSYKVDLLTFLKATN